MSVVSTSASGSTVVAAAVTGKSVVMLRYHMMANGATNVQFTDDDGNVLSGIKYFPAAGAGASDASIPNGVFRSPVSKGIKMTNSAAVAVSVDFDVRTD